MTADARNQAIAGVRDALWAEFARYPQANPNHWAMIAVDALFASGDQPCPTCHGKGSITGTMKHTEAHISGPCPNPGCEDGRVSGPSLALRALMETGELEQVAGVWVSSVREYQEGVPCGGWIEVGEPYCSPAPIREGDEPLFGVRSVGGSDGTEGDQALMAEGYREQAEEAQEFAQASRAAAVEALYFGTPTTTATVREQGT